MLEGVCKVTWDYWITWEMIPTQISKLPESVVGAKLMYEQCVILLSFISGLCDICTACCSFQHASSFFLTNYWYVFWVHKWILLHTLRHKGKKMWTENCCTVQRSQLQNKYCKISMLERRQRRDKRMGLSDSMEQSWKLDHREGGRENCLMVNQIFGSLECSTNDWQWLSRASDRWFSKHYLKMPEI